jgi:hypothetical protein
MQLRLSASACASALSECWDFSNVHQIQSTWRNRPGCKETQVNLSIFQHTCHFMISCSAVGSNDGSKRKVPGIVGFAVGMPILAHLHRATLGRIH